MAILAICIVCLGLVVWVAAASSGPRDLYLAMAAPPPAVGDAGDAPAVPYTSH